MRLHYVVHEHLRLATCAAQHDEPGRCSRPVVPCRHVCLNRCHVCSHVVGLWRAKRRASAASRIRPCRADRSVSMGGHASPPCFRIGADVVGGPGGPTAALVGRPRCSGVRLELQALLVADQSDPQVNPVGCISPASFLPFVSASLTASALQPLSARITASAVSTSPAYCSRSGPYCSHPLGAGDGAAGCAGALCASTGCSGGLGAAFGSLTLATATSGLLLTLLLPLVRSGSR